MVHIIAVLIVVAVLYAGYRLNRRHELILEDRRRKVWKCFS